MSKDNDNKPRRRRLKVTEEALGENEMFRVKRRTVTLPLDGASDANLREFYQKLEDSERIDTTFAHKLISDLAAIEAKLDELGYPPPRGRYIIQDDHWGALPEDWNLSLAEEHGARSQVVDPAAPYGIETGFDYIKCRAEVLSLPWWLGHLGDLLIRILSETDLNRALNLTLQYGGDRQRYRDQHGYLAEIQHGREFHPRPTDEATDVHVKKAEGRKNTVITMARLMLKDGKGRLKNRRINVRALAKLCTENVLCPVRVDRAIELIKEVVETGELR